MERAVAEARSDVARRLHDGPVQQLTAAQLFLDSALMQIPEDERHPMLVRGLDALREAIASCRALMGELADGGQGP